MTNVMDRPHTIHTLRPIASIMRKCVRNMYNLTQAWNIGFQSPINFSSSNLIGRWSKRHNGLSRSSFNRPPYIKLVTRLDLNILLISLFKSRIIHSLTLTLEYNIVCSSYSSVYEIHSITSHLSLLSLGS